MPLVSRRGYRPSYAPPTPEAPAAEAVASLRAERDQHQQEQRTFQCHYRLLKGVEVKLSHAQQQPVSAYLYRVSMDWLGLKVKLNAAKAAGAPEIDVSGLTGLVRSEKPASLLQVEGRVRIIHRLATQVGAQAQKALALADKHEEQVRLLDEQLAEAEAQCAAKDQHQQWQDVPQAERHQLKQLLSDTIILLGKVRGCKRLSSLERFYLREELLAAARRMRIAPDAGLAAGIRKIANQIEGVGRDCFWDDTHSQAASQAALLNEEARQWRARLFV